MLDLDHPLASLQIQAALASGWPTLHVLAPSEEAALDAQARVQAILGPVPQADVIEPWDPTAADEPWELRIDLPELAAARWDELRSALEAATGTVHLVPGVRPGMRSALDSGHRAYETLADRGVTATLYFDTEGGDVLSPDLHEGAGDEAIEALQTELVAALQAHRVPFLCETSRGPDTVQAVVDRQSGRFGVKLWFAPANLDVLDGDALLATRRDIVAAVTDVVIARALHPAVRLAPDLRIDLRLGLSVVAWLIGPAAPGLPGEAGIPLGRVPGPDVLATWVEGLDGLSEGLEVQVIPERAADHDRVVDGVIAIAEDADWPLLGALPRWLPLVADDQRQWCFAPVWRWTSVAPDSGTIVAVLERLAGLPGVAAARIVPGEPRGIGEAWSQVEVSWFPGPARCLVRLHDGLTEHDRLPRAQERTPTDRDHEVAGLLDAAVAPEVLVIEPIADSAGRQGLQVLLDASHTRSEALQPVLAGLAAAHHDALATVGHLGFLARPLVLLWYRT